MKTTFIVITLICGCIASTYSQINQNHKRDLTADSLSKFHYENDRPIGFEMLFKGNSFKDHKIGFLSYNNNLTSIPEKTYVQDNMPCYEPDGIFSMRIIKPDTTITYKMLVKRY